MNLEGRKIKVEGNRVIGIKSSDMNSLAEAYSKKESSFIANPAVASEPMIQNQPIVEVVPEIMPTINPEPVETSNIIPEVQVENPTFIQPLEPEVKEEPVITETPTPEPNMFDIPVAEPTTPTFETPAPVVETPQVVPVDTFQVPQEEVQGGVANSANTELDTPQNFFERVEEPANDTILTQEMVENNKAQTYDDPAIIMIDNIRKVVEDKNEMIKALNNKIKVLEEQLRNVEEARKVSEAQRVAAETTLAQAKSAAMPNINQGPTLVYGQPMQNQNYNQAA